MAFDEAWLEHIPPQPEMDLDEPTRQAFAYSMRELAGFDKVQDALTWVFRVAQEGGQLGGIARTVPSLDRLALGFFDPEVDGTDGLE